VAQLLQSGIDEKKPYAGSSFFLADRYRIFAALFSNFSFLPNFSLIELWMGTHVNGPSQILHK
jgi:hypothetical protein